jgi:hypothetical protein
MSDSVVCSSTTTAPPREPVPDDHNSVTTRCHHVRWAGLARTVGWFGVPPAPLWAPDLRFLDNRLMFPRPASTRTPGIW